MPVSRAASYIKIAISKNIRSEIYILIMYTTHDKFLSQDCGDVFSLL